MNGTETAKEFWKNQKTYPKYGTIKQRRLYELNYLIPHLKGVESILDIGCGDGAVIKCLQHLTDIEKYYACDIAEDLMKDIPAETFICDCTNPPDFPEVDFTMCAGVIPYIFEDNSVIDLLKSIKSKRVYIKAPCTLLPEDDLVNTFSEKLQAEYASRYRTVDSMKELIEQVFEIQEVVRAYPDDIESEFGTKQYIFLCSKQKQ